MGPNFCWEGTFTLLPWDPTTLADVCTGACVGFHLKGTFHWQRTRRMGEEKERRIRMGRKGRHQLRWPRGPDPSVTGMQRAEAAQRAGSQWRHMSLFCFLNWGMVYVYSIQLYELDKFTVMKRSTQRRYRQSYHPPNSLHQWFLSQSFCLFQGVIYMGSYSVQPFSFFFLLSRCNQPCEPGFLHNAFEGYRFCCVPRWFVPLDCWAVLRCMAVPQFVYHMPTEGPLGCFRFLHFWIRAPWALCLGFRVNIK